MKTITVESRVASFVIAGVLLLQISSGLASGHPKTARHNDDRGGVEVTFTKWVTDWPNMAGLVSGHVGGGLFAGEVLDYAHTDAIDRIEALYHVKGRTHSFTAHVRVKQNNLKGTAVIKGVITDGWLKGARVHGRYQVISPCGIINAQNGTVGDVCFQGTVDIGADED